MNAWMVLIDVLDIDALLDRLVAVDGDEALRHVGQERGVDCARVPDACRAAARNLSTLPARNGTSLPERSSRTNVKPPEVPTPGMAGGENENAIP